MKRMKKIVSILLAVVMVLGMSVTAMASSQQPQLGTQTGNLKVMGVKEEKTYDLYRVFDLTYAGNAGQDKGYSYTVNKDFAEFFTGKSMTDPVADLSKMSDNATELSTLAKELLAYAIEKKIKPVATVTATEEDETAGYATVNGLQYGYYLLNPLGGSIPSSEFATMFALNTLSGEDMEIQVKAVYPTIDKNVTDDNETTPDKVDEISIGKPVTFHLNTKVPDTTGYDHYWFVINDTLSKGLTFEGIVVDGIKIGGKVITPVAADAADEEKVPGTYTLTSKKNATTGETAVKIVFNDFKEFLDANSIVAGADITVDYTAILNADAIINGANPNTVTLTYSSDPKYSYDGSNEPGDTPNPNQPTGTTPESVTETFTTALQIVKKDEAGAVLPGAAFRITGDALATVVTTGEVYTEDAGGTYWLLKDGTYTTEDPATPNMDTSKYADPSKKYKLETKTVMETKATNSVDAEAYVDSKTGVLIFAGLGVGEYRISETVVPVGYNAIADFPVKVEFNDKTKGFTVTRGEYEVRDGAEVAVYPENGKGALELSALNAYSTDVINMSGALLPSTGGIGTTIFYVGGGILVLAAVVLLVTKKRMSAEK